MPIRDRMAALRLILPPVRERMAALRLILPPVRDRMAALRLAMPPFGSCTWCGQRSARAVSVTPEPDLGAMPPR